jgi:Protein of unknown function (DUF3618)
MRTDQDEIRADLDRTRENLNTDVDALANKASPNRMVKERTDRVRGVFRGAKDKVMGTAADVGERTSSAASSTTSAVSGTASSVSDSAAAAPAKAKGAAEGNPIAAGVIVFGAAWLVSSLLPKSQREQQAAQQVKSAAQEHAGQAKEAVGEAAQQMQEGLRGPAQEAAESVKSTATSAASSVKEDAQSATQDVRDRTAQSPDNVQS